MSIDKQSYDDLGIEAGGDFLEELEDHLPGYSYICDGISEIADSNIDIYNYDLWDSAKDFQEWTEQAMGEGLADPNSKDFTLEKAFQAGQYQYYTQVAYENEKALYFNILVNLLNDYPEEDQALFEEDDLEAIAEEIGSNNRGDIFKEKLDEKLQELKEEESEE